MQINTQLKIFELSSRVTDFFELARKKTLLLNKEYDVSQGSPVFTAQGKYTSRGWTEWTQGFQFGIPLLIFDATNDMEMLKLGRARTLSDMAHHISHFGVHDHGFNNLSTYGNLLRLARQQRFSVQESEKELYALALKMSGSVQAKRWTTIRGGGYIYSFNGPHSLFVDTMRTCRILLLAHIMGHRMLDESDRQINLLERALIHGLTTAKHAVYSGEGRDSFDIRGRVAHESIFNINDGSYRCPNSQQGYSGFTTWTRGLAWAILGFTEFLEFLDSFTLQSTLLAKAISAFMKAALATSDFYIENTSLDGIPYWDTGAPGLVHLGDYTKIPASPDNSHEPIDSSAAAIAAQGLFRMSRLVQTAQPERSEKYLKAGLTTLDSLLSDRFLSKSESHQGILLHSVYHHPNGWDYIPAKSKVPHGESSMWGDYHMVELCLLAKRMAEGKYYSFFEGF